MLDVREDDEWQQGHVAGSLHIPFHDLRDSTPDELQDADTPIAVACSAGNRSALAVSLLRRSGIEKLIHVADGGIQQLDQHSIELVTEAVAR